MKARRIKALLWAAAGGGLTLLGLMLVLWGLTGNTLLTRPEAVPETLEQVLACLQAEDWPGLEARIQGSPDLVPPQEQTLEGRLWQLYCRSLQWEFTQPFSRQGDRVSQPVTVTCLDVAAMKQAVARRIQRLDPAERTPEQIQAEAAAVLAGELPTCRKEITLTLLRQPEAWLVVPDENLKALLTGFSQQ